ncbi:hypothetical protein KAFR_0D04520 [Kazachstania africana CBS 2517]|uniref:PIH1 N-terminal domain-containing protein n=1 Tax=Kazachstania africana (strain ATCC 22294 / BCRC 22015 / CBS 2517 / CECT 1963 / NBRC 1671 / NRRL Y-8276) TaxID=1071382 RepID=H2AUQ0_KAZAF|nr:hypothetical protein KAFR_0D04520 [Kazachstania africana CBS 2517]CCF58100.1 hypothetical protein KAFR_0D04520 [Kazachstania africana CBS 2517]
MSAYINPLGSESTTAIQPIPLFVIKSKIISAQPNLKLFINLSHAKEIPLPKSPFSPKTTYNEIMNNQWEIPIITSPSRIEKDKKGNKCTVYDCIINSQLVDTVLDVTNVNLKQILIEWCFESIEIIDNVIIDRENIKFPKLKFKCEGQDKLPELEVRNEQFMETEKKNDDIQEFLQMKRDLIEKDGIDSDELPALFPLTRNNNNGGDNEMPKNKVVIEDITNEWQKMKQKSKISENVHVIKKDINFVVTMKKITKEKSAYKLKIEIESEIESSLDLNVSYNLNDNELLIENSNTIEFNPKRLNLLLPNFIKELKYSSKDFKTYFIKREKKLYIFV